MPLAASSSCLGILKQSSLISCFIVVFIWADKPNALGHSSTWGRLENILKWQQTGRQYRRKTFISFNQKSACLELEFDRNQVLWSEETKTAFGQQTLKVGFSIKDPSEILFFKETVYKADSALMLCLIPTIVYNDTSLRYHCLIAEVLTGYYFSWLVAQCLSI